MNNKPWWSKLPKNHSNKTTNYCITNDDRKKEKEYIGKPIEHEPYIGVYLWAKEI